MFNGLKRLRKDVSGYDLKQLLIGAEGTLGVVTAASLKLFPVLRSRAVAFAGLRSPEDALELLAPRQGGERRRRRGVRADEAATASSWC